jgi:hypothetical protein
METNLVGVVKTKARRTAATGWEKQQGPLFNLAFPSITLFYGLVFPMHQLFYAKAECATE